LGLGRGGGGFFFCFLLFSLVPIMFHMCSRKVPQVLKLLPKTFPIAPRFYPIWFARSSTLMYINWKGRPQGAHLFLFCNRWSKEVLLLKSAQCSKKIGDGQTNMAPSKKQKLKRKVWAHPWTN
jgi:hypothetical protein